MFELNIAQDLEKRGVPFDYEKVKLTYTVEHTYKPDFGVGGKVIIEAKGYFTSADRSKLLAVKRANPEIDLRLLFMRASNKLNKESETTYADWADKHGFTWAEGTSVPAEWIKSVRRERSRLSRPGGIRTRHGRWPRTPSVVLAQLV